MQRGDTLQVNLIDSPVLDGNRAEPGRIRKVLDELSLI